MKDEGLNSFKSDLRETLQAVLKEHGLAEVRETSSMRQAVDQALKEHGLSDLKGSFRKTVSALAFGEGSFPFLDAFLKGFPVRFPFLESIVFPFWGP